MFTRKSPLRFTAAEEDRAGDLMTDAQAARAFRLAAVGLALLTLEGVGLLSALSLGIADIFGSDSESLAPVGLLALLVAWAADLASRAVRRRMNDVVADALAAEGTLDPTHPTKEIR